MRICIVSLAATTVLMSGCAGLGAPIGAKMPSNDRGRAEFTKTVGFYAQGYSDPARLALWRIAQWDQAIQNIQGANTASNIGLASIASIVGYRAARDLSTPATAGWATAGLLGLSMTEAFVQVSRISVYSEGIKGMECALSAYGVDHIKAIVDQAAKENGSAKGTAPPEAGAISTRAAVIQAAAANIEGGHAFQIRVEQIRAAARAELDDAMLDAVSVIGRKVDEALMGSIVRATSRGQDWSAVFAPALTPEPTLTSEAIRNNPQAASTLITALAEARAAADDTAARIERIKKCDIGGVTTTIDAVGKPLAIDLLGQTVLSLTPGDTKQFRVHGGSGRYSIGLTPQTGSKLPVVELTSSGVRLVIIKTEKDTTPGDYSVVIEDPSQSAAVAVPFNVKAPATKARR